MDMMILGQESKANGKVVSLNRRESQERDDQRTSTILKANVVTTNVVHQAG
jgi:hypothetical protein